MTSGIFVGINSIRTPSFSIDFTDYKVLSVDKFLRYIIIMFIQENRLKIKLKSGLPAYGVLSTTDDPQLAELFGLAGFDYYMLDAEHGLIDPIQAVNVIR